MQSLSSFPAFYGNRRFIIWRSKELSTYRYPEPGRSNPHTLAYLHTINLNVIQPPKSSLPSGLFPFYFPTNNLYVVLFSHIRATWPVHLILSLSLSLYIYIYIYIYIFGGFCILTPADTPVFREFRVFPQSLQENTRITSYLS
jgi:hypothetical protein